MQLPEYIQETLDQIFKNVDITHLKHSSQLLSTRYRIQDHALTSDERLAYLAVRMPATFSALCSVFNEIKNYHISSMLDLGAGPATGGIAAKEIFSELKQITCLEKDPKFISYGKKLLKEAEWIEKNFSEIDSFPPHDLIVFSYSYGEYQNKEILIKAWKATRQTVIIIEPGTMHGYHTMLDARDELIRLGGHVLAPCPHSKQCPLQSPDWCHFPARVERSELHKRLKQGSLSYEDEKFSYAIVSKEKPPFSNPRILEDPIKRSGHIHFKLCCEKGIENRIVSKREKEFYKSARRKKWGEKL